MFMFIAHESTKIFGGSVVIFYAAK